MDFYVMTLFPEMINNALSESITGRAIKNGLMSVEAVDIRDFATNKTGHIDDYIFGGGSGMLIQAEPVYLCYKSIEDRIIEKRRLKSEDDAKTTDSGSDNSKPYCVYMSPQGRRFDQSIARELSKKEEVIFLCGHYEGIDERALSLICDDELSLGDFVLTGGELPAITMIDAVSRLIPGVLGDMDSAVYETFNDGLVEYPQYTRPRVFMDMEVPQVLLSGDHKKIDEWRFVKALERTREKRPDMYEEYLKTHDLAEKKMKKLLDRNGFTL